jgi:hypothetical protein
MNLLLWYRRNNSWVLEYCCLLLGRDSSLLELTLLLGAYKTKDTPSLSVFSAIFREVKQRSSPFRAKLSFIPKKKNQFAGGLQQSVP